MDNRTPWLRSVAKAAAALVLGGGWLLAATVLFVFPGWTRGLAAALAALFVGGTILAAAKLTGSRRWLAILGPVLGVGVLWATLSPSNDRTWITGQEFTPHATFDGDRVTITHVRNATWQTTSEGEVRWETRSYDLRTIQSLDLVVEPFDDWRGLAHIFVTFGFADGEHLAISIEARREVGEKYSPLRGAFRHFELLYVVGDERDLIGLRANVRRDPVHVYPAKAAQAEIRALFVSMLTRANGLTERPAFYNTLTSTCATGLLQHVNEVRTDKVSALDWRILFPGYADDLAWELGLIDFAGTLDEARTRFLINGRSAPDPALDGAGWSRKIRTIP